MLTARSASVAATLLIIGTFVACQNAGAKKSTAPSEEFRSNPGEVMLLPNAESIVGFDLAIPRSNLPLPERLHGWTFVSVDAGERGWQPGPMFEGHDLVTFGVSLLAWEHADMTDVYEYQVTEDGQLSASRPRDASITMQGAFDARTNQLTWNGRRFRLLSAGEARAHIEPPFEWLMAPGNNDGELEIDLASQKQSRGRLGFGLGSLTVQTYGIAGGFQVFDMLDEVEGSYAITRYRIPAADGKATVKLSNQGVVTTSFPDAESKVIRHGNFLLERPHAHFWRQKGIEVEGQWWAVHWCDLRDGTGAPVQAGQQVAIRCFFYADNSFENYLPAARQGVRLSYRLPGDDKPAGFLSTMVAGMTVGGWRRTFWFAGWPPIPDGVAPPLKPDEKWFVEFRLDSASDP